MQIFDLHASIFSLWDGSRWRWSIAVGFIASFSRIFYLRSFKVASISFSCIFISWSVVVLTMLGIVCLGESTAATKFLGAALVMLAVGVANFKNLRLEHNHVFALLAGVMFGITYTIDKHVIAAIHPLIYMVWTSSAIALFGLLQAPLRSLRAIRGLRPRDLAPLCVSASAYFLYILCTFSAYATGGEVGRIDAINNSQVFLIIAVEYLLFRQRQGVGRKLGAALLAAAGVLLLRTVA